MGIFPTTEQVYDQNYNLVTREVEPERLIAQLEVYAQNWEGRAAEMERSADRWAARGDGITAARNLETAREYRQMAEDARQEAGQIRSAT